MLSKSVHCQYMMVVLFFSLLISVSSLAQNQDTMQKEKQELEMHRFPVIKTPMKFSGKKSIAKGSNDEYVIVEQRNYIIVYNKSNTLIHTYSSFMEEENMRMDLINFDKPLLDSYVNKILSPLFGNKPDAFPDLEFMSVSLYADRDGNIKELTMSYPKDAKIPVSAIEKFEDIILKSNLKLVFDKNSPYFRDATWVSITWMYSAEELRKRGGKE